MFILQVIIDQCEKRNTKLQKSMPFHVTNGEMLFISSDFSSVNNDGWRLTKSGILNVSNFVVFKCIVINIRLNNFQITHLQDFKYWEIFSGLTPEEIREREEDNEYPPRLQIECKQTDTSKSLQSSFKVSKRNMNNEIQHISQFPLNNIMKGNVTLHVLFILKASSQSCLL